MMMPNNIFQMFPQFMQQMRGMNPSQLIQQALNSGGINQQQLNQLQNMQQQMLKMFDGEKNKYGF